MIAQGTHGVSRADLLSGVMGGQDFLEYLPLNESVLEKQKGLNKTLQTWVANELQVATTENWFDGVF